MQVLRSKYAIAGFVVKTYSSSKLRIMHHDQPWKYLVLRSNSYDILIIISSLKECYVKRILVKY